MNWPLNLKVINNAPISLFSSCHFVCATQGKGPAHVYFNVSISFLHTRTHVIS